MLKPPLEVSSFDLLSEQVSISDFPSDAGIER
jgi:hypothetical protein